MAMIELENDNLNIFPGLYESVLYNSDTDYYIIQSLQDDEEREIIDIKYNFNELINEAGMSCANSLYNGLYSHDVVYDIDYVGMDSPKYYNYDTDRVLLNIYYNPFKLYRYIYKHLEDFKKYLKKNYTSYDGYMSFVDNTWHDFKYNFKSKKNMYIQVMIEFYLISEINMETHTSNMYEDIQSWIYSNMELIFKGEEEKHG